MSIGEAPSRERAFHHALWRQALTALGHPADALDYATASDAELREMRDAWRRAQAWAPEFVADDLHTARELAEEYRRDAVIWRAGLDRHPAGSPERELAERDLAAAEQLAAVSAARVEALERIQAVRTDWFERHRELQERAAFAGDELERRGLDRDTAAPIGEQQELFRLPDGEHATDEPEAGADSAATPAGGAVRGLDPAQQQLDLDEVPRAVPAAAPTGARTPRARPRATAASASRGVTAGPADAQRRRRDSDPRERPRAGRPTVPTVRPTATPSCSPRPNVRPSASVSSPRCSTPNPPPPTSPPRSRCTSTTPRANSAEPPGRTGRSGRPPAPTADSAPTDAASTDAEPAPTTDPHRGGVQYQRLRTHRLAGGPASRDHR